MKYYSIKLSLKLKLTLLIIDDYHQNKIQLKAIIIIAFYIAVFAFNILYRITINFNIKFN